MRADPDEPLEVAAEALSLLLARSLGRAAVSFLRSRRRRRRARAALALVTSGRDLRNLHDVGGRA